MAHAAPVAVVTGATGFVASELVKQLLEKGYTVRGTVRSLHDETKVQHLERLGKALPGQLTLHEADLLKVCLCLLQSKGIPCMLAPTSMQYWSMLCTAGGILQCCCGRSLNPIPHSVSQLSVALCTADFTERRQSFTCLHLLTHSHPVHPGWLYRH